MVSPRKLDPSRIVTIEKKMDHDGIFYNLETKSLHTFRTGFHVVRRPVEIAYMDEFLTLIGGLHQEEIYFSSGAYLMTPNIHNHYHIELKVRLVDPTCGPI